MYEFAMTKDEVTKKLLGAWRYVGTRIHGGNWDRGANPKGMIYYGPHGEMAVQIAHAQRHADALLRHAG